MQNTEIDLRNQISLYNEKYEEFQNALARSNKVFAGFKGDMELVSKHKIYITTFIRVLYQDVYNKYYLICIDVKKNSQTRKRISQLENAL